MLWKRDLQKTVRRTRAGILTLLVPMVLAAVVAVSFSGAQTEGKARLASIVLMNMWFVAVDFGVYPVRLFKRLRPIFLTYEVPLLAMLVASSIYATVNLAIRCGVIMLLMPSHADLSLSTGILLCVLTGVLSIGCFSLGTLFASVSLSIHEVFIYAPHIFYGLGILSGFIEIPAVTSRLSILTFNPIASLAGISRSLLTYDITENPIDWSTLLAIIVIMLASIIVLSWSRHLARVVTLL